MRPPLPSITIRPRTWLLSCAPCALTIRRASTLTERQKHLDAATCQWTWAEEDLERAQVEIRERAAAFPDGGIAKLHELREQNRTVSYEMKQIASRQKHLGNEIKRLMGLKSKPDRPKDWEAQVARTKEQAAQKKEENNHFADQVEQIQREALDLRLLIPNSTHPAVPRGPEENAKIVAAGGPSTLLPHPANELVGKTIGEIADGQPLSQVDHLAVAARVADSWVGIDMASGVTAAGASWPYLLGRISMLEQALTQHALSLAHKRGFVLVSPPEVVRTDVAARCGFNPRGEVTAQTYFVTTGELNADPADDLCLVGTAEVALGALVAGKTFPPPGSEQVEKFHLEQTKLPLQMVALSHAFRAEAGARGADTRGLYRVHQFAKAELFVVCYASESDAYLETLRGMQESVIASLGLPYRVLDMPSEELGASAARKYDIEVWMPGRGSWGEVSSASNCTDFQARRLQIRHRPSIPTERMPFAHTLNATAAAVPRLIVALLENYGVTDRGQLRLPRILSRYWLAGPEDPLVEWVDIE